MKNPLSRPSFPVFRGFVVLFCCSFFLPSCASLQSTQYAVDLSEETLRAEKFISDGDYERGLVEYEKGLKKYRAQKDELGELFCLERMGWLFKENGDYGKALKFFLEAYPLGARLNGDAAEIDADIGDIYLFSGDGKRATEYYYRTLNAHKNFVFPTSFKSRPSQKELSELIRKSKAIIHARVNLGAKRLFDREMDPARENLQKAEALMSDIFKVINHPLYGMALKSDSSHHEGMGFIRFFLGAYYKEAGQVDEATRYLALAKESFVQGKSRVGLALDDAMAFQFVWLNDTRAAENLVARGDYEKGVAEYRKLLEKFKAENKRKQVLLCMERIGWLLTETGEYSSALDILREAREIGARANGDAAEIDASAGDVHLFSGNPEKASELYLEALAIHKGFVPPSGPVKVPDSDQLYQWVRKSKAIIHSRINLASAHYFVKNYQKGLGELDEADKLIQEVLKQVNDPMRGVFYRADGDLLEGIGHYYTVRGALLGEMRKFDEAFRHFDLGRESFLSSGRPFGLLLNRALRYKTEFLMPDRKISGRDLEEYDAFLGEAEDLGAVDVIWRASYEIAGALIKNNNYPEARKYLERAVNALELTRSRLREDTVRQMFASSGQDVYGRAIDLLFDMGEYADGFDYLERSKGRAFLDMLAGRSPKAKKTVDPALVQKEKDLRGQIEVVGRSLKTLKDDDRNAANTKFKRLLKENRDVLEKIKDQSLEYAATSSVAAVPVKKIMGSLRQGTALISYYAGEKRTLVWVATRDAITAVAADAGSAELAQLVQDYRDAIASRQETLRLDLGKNLSAVLLDPIKDKLVSADKLLVVPSGPIHYLPFSSLPLAGNRFLVQDYAISILPNASSLFYLDKEITANKDRILALGNPKREKKGLELEFAEQEIKAISRNFPRKTVLTGDQATESWIKEKNLLDTAIVHFAAHGRYNARDPLKSAILLANDPREDGDLETFEIYSLTMNSRLVVLSACQSGLGKLGGGDEVQSLNRAFLYAGAGGVVASLWKVSDESTYKLMQYFYDDLPKGAALALKNAQLKLMRDYPSPYFWAPFYLTGKMDL